MKNSRIGFCPGLSFLFAWLLVVGLCAGQGSESENDRRAQLEKELSQLEEHYKALRDGEGAPEAYKEYVKLEQEINTIRQEHARQLTEPQRRYSELYSNNDVMAWREKLQKHYEKVRVARRELKGEIHKRARELYERRHRELADAGMDKAPQAEAFGFTALTYPRVNGSTSAQPLGRIIACKVLSCPYKWSATSRYSGRWGVGEDLLAYPTGPWAEMGPGMPATSMADYYGEGYQFSLVGYRPVAIAEDLSDVPAVRLCTMINRMLTIHAGTHGAYVQVINGNSDLALVARQPSEDELELAKKEGVELEVTPFALDAFVFIRHYENPVKSLTIGQLQDIYTGKIVSWREVGGADEKIRAYQRNRNSGSQELMEKLVMQDREFKLSPHGRAPNVILNGMGGPYLALSRDKTGIAYSVYYYEHFMAGSPNTELIAVNGFLPTYETISNGDYPYVTRVYAVTKAGLDPETGAAKIRRWLLSPEGQTVVRESGYVPFADADRH